MLYEKAKKRINHNLNMTQIIKQNRIVELLMNDPKLTHITNDLSRFSYDHAQKHLLCIQCGEDETNENVIYGSDEELKET